MSYAAGEAHRCYGPPVTRYARYVALVRPSLILVVDDLDTAEPVETQWLLHAKERFALDEKEQVLVSRRGDASMTVRLFTPGGFAFGQSNAWPVDPKKDYPMATAEPPAKQWHFAARTLERSRSLRIASVITVSNENDEPECQVQRIGPDTMEILARFGNVGQARAVVELGGKPEAPQPIIAIRYEPRKGEAEHIAIP